MGIFNRVKKKNQKEKPWFSDLFDRKFLTCKIIFLTGNLLYKLNILYLLHRE